METLNVNKLPRHIFVGYRGENDTRGYAFDYSEWKEEHGEGELTINFQRPDDTVVYPVTLIIEGTKAIWLPSLIDTQNEGSGEAQIVYTVGNKIKKTAVLAVHVSRSLGPAGEVPEPYEDVLDRIDKLVGETRQNAESAEESASSAAESAAAAEEAVTSIGDSVEIATQKAEEAETSATNAAGYAASARDSLARASAAATAAQTARDEAERSAEDTLSYVAMADESANKARNYAQNASASAGAAGTSAQDAAASATDSESSATAAAGSASDAASSATAAAGSASAAAESAESAAERAEIAADCAERSLQHVEDTQTMMMQTEEMLFIVQDKAKEAATSATSAASSATAASGSASQAAQAKTDAESAAAQAAGSATASATSAGNASTSAQAAANSATAAANSASAAAQSAQEAEDVLESIPELYDELVDDMDNFKRDLVLVQETQPTSEDNRLWVVTDEGEEIQVPTYAEHLALAEKVDDLDDRVELLEEFAKEGEYTPSQIQKIAASGHADKYFSIGDIINIEWTDYTPATPVKYTVPHVVTHFGDVEDENGVVHKNAMWLMWMYATPQLLQFDAPEKILADEETFQSGYYYYEKVSDHSMFGYHYEERTVTVGETIPSGAEYYKHVRSGMVDRLFSGSNDWSQSAVRQWLNSSGGKGEWWVPQHMSDVAPDQASTMPGFLTGYDAEWLAVFKPTKVSTALNTVCDGGRIVTTYDKFFLPSIEQMYGEPQMPGVEGEYWEYWKEETGLSAPSNGGSSNPSDARKIPIISNIEGAAYHVWLRSSQSTTACGVGCVWLSGYLTYTSASSSLTVQPSCVIY